MLRMRPVLLGSVLALSLAFGPGRPAAASGAEPSGTVTAFLDGKAIPLADVSKYYCDDFSYPEIQCSTSQWVTSARGTVVSLLTSVDYVTIFDQASYYGPFMNVSQDYPALVLMGWSDRISSFKARNGETGTFYVDWLYSGSQWSFCCNQQLPTLGGYDNTFSSLHRT